MDTDVLHKIPEIKKGLADIIKTNQAILKQLDTLEERKRRKQLKQQQLSEHNRQQTENEQACTSAATSDNKSTFARGQDTIGTVDRSEHTDEELGKPQAGDTETSDNSSTETKAGEEREADEHVISQSQTPSKDTHTERRRAADLKDSSDPSLQNGTTAHSAKQGERMEGFNERFKLTEQQIIYGSAYKRNLTDMYQDNRFCDKFGLPANTGRIYESLRKQDIDEQHNKSEVLQAAERRQVEASAKHLADTTNSTEAELVSTPSSTRHILKSARPSFHPKGVPPIATERPPKRHETTSKKGSVQWQGCSVTQLLGSIAGLFGDNTGMTRAVEEHLGGVVIQVDSQRNTVKISNTAHMKAHLSDMKQGLVQPGVNESNRKSLAEMIKHVELLCDSDQKEMDIDEYSKVFGEFIRDNPNGFTPFSADISQSKPDVHPSEFMEKKQKTNKRQVHPSASWSTTNATKLPPPKRDAMETLQTKGRQKLEREKQKNEQAERVYIQEELWSEYANEEISKAKVARDIRERGMDTIFCLDLSESMKGIAWDQALTFIRGFIEGIQNSTLTDDTYEHVALVTFGSETKVQQHLTCDYFEITRKLERLHPAGPSPLFAGLTMSRAAVIGAGAIFVANGYKIYPRIFLLTDGNVTPANLIAGPDSYEVMKSTTEKDKIMSLALQLHLEVTATINPVPVGDYDLSLLENIAKSTEGKIVSPEDWVAQSKTFKNYLAASKVKPFIKSPEMTLFCLDNMVGGGASSIDQAQMGEFLRTHKRNHSSDGNSGGPLEIATFPQLGSRVRRNPELSSHFMAKQVGTVCSHMTDGHIGVTWDEAILGCGKVEKVTYGNGIYGVVVTDDPRILGDDELIDVGCRVRRGPDWHYKDQDGGAGNLGSVFKVDEHGFVNVRWDKGVKRSYRCGHDAKFDLEVVQTREKPRKEKEHAPTIKEMNMRNVEEMNKRNASSCSTNKDSKNKPGNLIIEDMIEGTHLRGAVSSDAITQEQTIGTFVTTEHRRLGSLRSDLIRTQDSPTLNESITERKNKMNMSDVTRVSDISMNESSDQSGNNSPPNTNTASIDTSSGTRPKAYQTPKPVKDASSDKEIEWLWKEGDEWCRFPRKLTDKIEANYQNSQGTVLIEIDSQQYRIVFSRMERVNIATKEKCQVTRN